MRTTNEIAGHDKYGRPYHKVEYAKDRRRFRLSVDGELHNVGVFRGEESALRAAAAYSKQIGRPVDIKEG